MSSQRQKTILSSWAVLMAVAIAVASAVAKETQTSANSNNQPLAGLDRVLKQANGVKVDAIVDNKLATNVTNALNEMASNLRKMIAENRRLNQQVQDLVNRVQNATGVNATSTFGSIQQQASNFTNNVNLKSMSTMMPRFEI